ncbi:hypothetical protein M408DRAFT_329606 [Serendipita vermifera MAFF 305830]|uniref:C2H2-type domain-containing protein n=1 Tax=Serendipita vermifera MAFF 305830 TaxID=933852 RepID=A0A0C2XGL8_SERVB|nr:hypothetical protein M408DRAFT_329606 [Serendipita vermifera MAFF 305830]
MYHPDITGDEHAYGTVPPTSWPILNDTSSSPTTPKNYYTEWNLGATDLSAHPGASSGHPWAGYTNKPTFVDNSFLTNDHAYGYGHPLHQDYYAPGLLVPPHTEQFPAPQYTPNIPQDFTALRLDTTATQHQQYPPPVIPTLSQQHQPASNPTPSPTTLSPTSPSSSSLSGKKDADDEYLPGPSRRTRRNCSKSKRRTTSPFSCGESTTNNEGKHACTFPGCTLAFARARDLKRHFRLHSGELPYSCVTCGRGFIRSDARGRHYRSQPECAQGASLLLSGAPGAPPQSSKF